MCLTYCILYIIVLMKAVYVTQNFTFIHKFFSSLLGRHSNLFLLKVNQCECGVSVCRHFFIFLAAVLVPAQRNVRKLRKKKFALQLLPETLRPYWMSHCVVVRKKQAVTTLSVYEWQLCCIHSQQCIDGKGMLLLHSTPSRLLQQQWDKVSM